MVYQILNLFLSFLTLVLTIVMLFTFRKPRRITAGSALFSGLISLIFPVIYLIITGVRPDFKLALPFVSFGMMLGYLRGTSMKLEFVGDEVVGRHSRIFLLLWGVSLAINQALSSFNDSILTAIGLTSLFLGTGTQLGFYGMLAARRMALIPADLDTGRLRNPGVQRLVSLAFGGLLIVILIESILLSIPALPFLSGQRTAAQESQQDYVAVGPDLQEDTTVGQDLSALTSYFTGDEVLVWTRPLAGFLSDSDHILYAFSADGSSVRQVYDQSISALDSPSPQLSPDGNLWVVTSKRSGESQQYLMTADGSDFYQPLFQASPVTIMDWSPDASHFLAVTQAAGSWDVVIGDRAGENWQQLAAESGDEIYPRWSPAGGEILYQSNQDGNQDIYLVSTAGGLAQNLTLNPAEDKRATWALEGTRIVFTSNRDGVYGLYHMNRDGSDLRQIAQDPGCGFKYYLSPDGDHLVYAADSYYSESGDDNENTACLSSSYTLASLSSGTITGIEISEYTVPKWSPDGERLLYNTPVDESSGRYSLYTIRNDGSGQSDLTPPDNEMFMSSWSADSTRVAQVESFFVEGVGGIFLLTVTNADGSGRFELAPIPWEESRAFAYKGFSWP